MYYTSIFIFIVILIVIFVIISNKKITEKFTEDTDILDIAPNYSSLEQNTADTYSIGFIPSLSTTPVRRDLPYRDCAIYQTTETQFCNEGRFNLPLVWYLNELKTERDQSKIDIYKRIVAAYQSLPNNQCKVTIPGWTEPIYSRDRVPMPYKVTDPNMVEILGAVNDNAYCFKEVSNPNEAKDAASWADGTAIVNDSADGKMDYDPYSDNKKYARITINTALYNPLVPVSTDAFRRADNLKDQICSIPGVIFDNIPTTYISFEFRSGDNFTVTNINTLYYEKNGSKKGTLQPYESTAQFLIYQNMFDTVVTPSGLYLTSKNISAKLATLTFDACERINSVPQAGRNVTFQFKVPQTADYKIYDSVPNGDVRYGTYNQLKAKLSTVQDTYDNLNNNYKNFLTSSSTPNYVRGLVKTQYILQTNQIPTNYGKESKIDIDNFFDALNPSTVKNITTKPKFFCRPGRPAESIQSVTWFPSGVNRNTVADTEDNCFDPNVLSNRNQWYAFKYEGFILPPESGNYSFWINSDDQSDIVINNKLVASYYGSHNLNTGGTNRPDITATELLNSYKSSGASILTRYQGKYSVSLRDLFTSGLSDERIIQLLNENVITNTIYLTAGTYYNIQIRLIQGGSDSGLSVYWLLPSQQGKTGCVKPEFRPHNIAIPDAYKCYDEIPAAAFYYNKATAPTSSSVRDKQSAVNNALNESNKLKTAIATMRENFIRAIVRFFNNANKQISDLTTLSVTVSDLSQKNYIASGKNMQKSLLYLSAEAISTDVDSLLNLKINTDVIVDDNNPVLTIDEIIDLSNYYRIIPTPVKDFSKCTYTISLFINIQNKCPNWRNILLHGYNPSNDNDRTPGLYIYPNDTTLQFRQSTVGNINNGCDLIKIRPRLKKWFHFAAVVNESDFGRFIKIYYNGNYVGSSLDNNTNSSGNSRPQWNSTPNNTDRKIYLNWYKYKLGWNFSAYGGYSIQKFAWYNSGLSNSAINEIFTTANIDTSIDLSNTFRIKDKLTGSYLKYNSQNNLISQDENDLDLYLQIVNDSTIFNNNQGAIGLMDANTGMYIRQSDGWLRQNEPQNNNPDFAWVFYRTDAQNEYNIFNFNQNTWLNFVTNYAKVDNTKRVWIIDGPGPNKTTNPAVTATILSSISSVSKVIIKEVRFNALVDASAGDFIPPTRLTYNPPIEGLTLQNGYQIWTIPTSGRYQIIAAGAAGGTAGGVTGKTNGYGGKGVIVSTIVNLIGGQQLKMVVGQTQARSSNWQGRSGGGGTYVATINNQPILVAGGGGGGGFQNDGGNGIVTTTGAYTGKLGDGGSSNDVGCGGAGFNGNGTISWVSALRQWGGQPAKSFINGATGGYGGSMGEVCHGAFGGGGASPNGGGFMGGGGGGGYSGGNAGCLGNPFRMNNNWAAPAGAGGSSYDINGTNNNATLYTALDGYISGYNSGQGFIIIKNI